MERKIQRRSMRLAGKGPGGVLPEDLALHLMRASAAKPGWRARNWIMSQEWSGACRAIGWPTDSPGILYGIHITVDAAAGFPRIERYLPLR
jgi:hypothetical protein